MNAAPCLKPPLIWTNVALFSLTALAALTVVPWYGVVHGYSAGAWGWFALFLVANGISITGGYHRLWAHRAYDARSPLKVLYLVFGAMALQNSALLWCTGHRAHHRYVDDNERDPYSARRGFCFSHIGWMLRDYPSGVPDFSTVPDLRRDRLVMLQHRFYVPLAMGTNVGLPLAAGWLIGEVWGTLLLAGVLRLVLSHHFTFFINSLAHVWGTQPYTDRNTARDNPLLALFTHGEGYHNYHHIFAHDYRNGVRWWQWDPTKWLIASLGWVGLTRNLRRVSDYQIQRAALVMQFQRAEQRLRELTGSGGTRNHVEQLRARIAQEYEAFVASMTEWARLKERWYEEKKVALQRHWSRTGAAAQLRAVERALQLQRRRMRVLCAQLA